MAGADAVLTARAPIQSRGIYESPSDDRTARVTGRWHFDPCDAATAELYRRDLSDHYRSVGTVRQWQLSSAIVGSPYKQSANRSSTRGHTHEFDSPTMDHCCRCCGHCIARTCGMVFLPEEKAIREAAAPVRSGVRPNCR